MTSALGHLDLTIDDLDWLAALRAVRNAVMVVTVGLDARKAESSG